MRCLLLVAASFFFSGVASAKPVMMTAGDAAVATPSREAEPVALLLREAERAELRGRTRVAEGLLALALKESMRTPKARGEVYLRWAQFSARRGALDLADMQAQAALIDLRGGHPLLTEALRTRLAIRRQILLAI